MLDNIKKWIKEFYDNNYTFNHEGFHEIIEGLIPIIQTFQEDEIKYVNGILGKILEKYEIKDYYYAVEIFEYEFVPLFEE